MIQGKTIKLLGLALIALGLATSFTFPSASYVRGGVGKIIVVNEFGSPIPNTRITVNTYYYYNVYTAPYWEEGSFHAISQTSDANGVVSFPVSENGKYEVEVTSRIYGTKLFNITIQNGATSTITVVDEPLIDHFLEPLPLPKMINPAIASRLAVEKKSMFLLFGIGVFGLGYVVERREDQ